MRDVPSRGDAAHGPVGSRGGAVLPPGILPASVLSASSAAAGVSAALPATLSWSTTRSTAISTTDDGRPALRRLLDSIRGALYRRDSGGNCQLHSFSAIDVSWNRQP